MEWIDLITKVFDHSFASRWTGACSGWTKELVIAHVIVDILIWLSYMAIPIFLLRITKSRKDIPFNIFFLLFAVFIIGCGITHLMDVITPFVPLYYLDFWMKFITAVASVITACMLYKSHSEIIKIPNPYVLEDVNKELENFALIAAHDLQDPLKQNKVFLRLIQEGKTEFIKNLVANHINLDIFINRLLEFARVGTNLKIEVNDTQTILNNVLKSLDLKVKNTKFEIGNLPVLKCDDVQLGRVFQNLISNAIKSKSPDRELVIQISARKIYREWEFSVKDNGLGISPDKMSNLFIMYRGVKNDSTGAGFGLAICKRVIEKHHGKIKAKSTPGEGTEFTFTIPEIY